MKNIIITGGELYNKGAQAMTFVTVIQLKKRFPDHQIYLLSEMDLNRADDEKKQYAFQFTGWYPIMFARAQQNPLLRLYCVLKHHEEFLSCEKLYRNCSLMVDISGYGLGSNWGEPNCNRYLDHVEFAKRFHIPIYLLPQSFGPFSFTGDSGLKTSKRIEALLPCAKTIFAREEKSYNHLTQSYHLKNVVLADDIVLASKEIAQDDLRLIFNDNRESIDIPLIENSSVAIVPNRTLLTNIGEQKVYDLYSALVQKLLALDHNVYLLTHASSDRGICIRIKEMFKDNDQVHFIDHDYDCIDYNNVVKRFVYIISSRYHGAVHALKNDIPCVALGWADKYGDLMKKYGLEQLSLNLKEKYDVALALDVVNLMDQKYADFHDMIHAVNDIIESDEVFSTISFE